MSKTSFPRTVVNRARAVDEPKTDASSATTERVSRCTAARYRRAGTVTRCPPVTKLP
jgi:hypothetical protein